MNNNNIPIPEPRIAEFEQLGLGMFVHFGLYSLLERGEWALHTLALDRAEYESLTGKFSVPTMSDIVETAKLGGCRYICLTTRHHDGFSLYDTRGLSDFDAPHSLAGRDLVREFVDLCRENGIKPFFYHTTLDWHNPDFKNDFDSYLSYLEKSVELLCTRYGEIGGFWFDGNWSRNDVDWHEDRLYSMIRRLQPNAMIINNTGLEKRGELGGEFIDSVTYERGMPTPIDRTGMKKYVAGEMCETLNNHWGIADDLNYKSVPRIIGEICDCRKVGANMLLNVGPAGDGKVSGMSRAIIESVGHFMSIYGEAIYNGRPYIAKEGQRDFILRHVSNVHTFYLFKFGLGNGGSSNVVPGFDPEKATSFEGFEQPPVSVQWMDNGEELLFKHNNSTLSVNATPFPYGRHYCVRVAKITV